MLIKWYLTLIVSLYFIQILSLKKLNQNNCKWLNELLRYVNNESKVNQLIFMTDDEEIFQNFKIDIITREMKRSTQTMSLILDKTTNSKNWIQHPSLVDSRATTMFIFFCDSSSQSFESLLSRSIKFLTELSGVNTRPKLLIIHLVEKDKFAYRKFFRDLWSKLFLDVTILQIIERKRFETGTGFELIKEKQERTFLYNFNPFTGIFDKKIFSFGSQMFPDKLRNLHGHRMNIGLINDPPFANVKRNLSDYPIEITGPNADLIKGLSEKMNFKMIFISSKEEFGNLGCEDSDLTGLFRKIVYNEIQIMGNFGYYSKYCESVVLFPTSRHLDPDGWVVVVPVIMSDSDITTRLSEKSFLSLAVTVIVINITWALLFLAKFDNRVWNPLSMFQSILGFTVDREPQKWPERIVFSSILVTQVIFSGYLHSLLTDVQLTSKSELKINNVEDLQKSGLTPVMYPLMKQVLKNIDVGFAHYFVSNSISLQNESEVDYLWYLVKYRNITCVVRRSTAEMLIRKSTQFQAVPPLKILTENLMSTWKIINFETGSPYIERFNQVLLYFMENGLFYKWNKHCNVELDDQWFLKERVYDTLTSKIFLLPAIGYLLACLVFIAEVLFDHFNRKRNAVVRRVRIKPAN